MLLHLFIAALWSPAGKGSTAWLLSVMFFFVFLLLYNEVSWARCGTYRGPDVVLDCIVS